MLPFSVELVWPRLGLRRAFADTTAVAAARHSGNAHYVPVQAARPSYGFLHSLVLPDDTLLLEVSSHLRRWHRRRQSPVHCLQIHVHDLQCHNAQCDYLVEGSAELRIRSASRS